MRRVLIVDDNPERLQALGAMMQAHGWETEAESQWIPVLELARRDPPALILAALPLLVAERHLSLRRSKATPSLAAVPFVVIRTPDSDVQDEELAVELGADAAVLYPGDEGALIARIRALFGDGAASVPPQPRSASDGFTTQLEQEVVIARLKRRIKVLEREQAAAAEDSEHLRMALDAARMGTFVRDLKTQRVRWVGAYKVLWPGDPRAREQSIAELEQTVHPEDLAAMRRAMQCAIDTNTEYEVDYRVVFNEKVRWIQGRGRPFYDAQGRPDRVMGIFFEVTERHLLEQQVRKTQKMEAIGLLAGGIAHDFNNILCAIIGNEELLRRTLPAGSDATIYVDEIGKASQRAKNLVQQILAFSRDQQIEKSALAPATSVLETASLLRATLPAEVELVTECEPDAPNVFADPTQLQQVLLNLGTNAWHALSGRPGRIVIALRNAYVRSDQLKTRAPLVPGRYAYITVTDNGMGIPPDILPRIFDPFFTTKPKGQGTGLGLAVVDEIVSGHLGGIWATSTPGVGTTFHLFFPATELIETPAPPIERTAMVESNANGVLKRVLYVDDEAALVRVMTRALTPFGYAVEGFTDVDAALARFRSAAGQFDLAMTDLTMPTASGMDVAHELLTIRPQLPVVLLSGYITTERREFARSLGIREVLPKPVTTQEVCAAIERALQAE